MARKVLISIDPSKGVEARVLTPDLEALIVSQDRKPRYPSAPYDKVVTLNYLEDKVLGGDVSYWQGEINWPIYSTQAKFVFIRAAFAGSAGGIFEDIRFQENAAGAEANGVIYGCYFFWRADIDPVVQANLFCTLIAGKSWKLLAVADAEVDDGQSPEVCRNNLIIFINTVKATLGIDNMLLYTRSTFWNVKVADTVPASDLQWEVLELFIARYTIQPLPWGNPGDPAYLIPRDHTAWKFWQFTSTGPGATFGASSTYIDLVYFNGTYQEFLVYANATQEETMIREPYNPALITLIAADGTNILSTPAGDVPVGGYIEIYAIALNCTKPINDARIYHKRADAQVIPLGRDRLDGAVATALGRYTVLDPGDVIQANLYDCPAGATITLYMKGAKYTPA